MAQERERERIKLLLPTPIWSTMCTWKSDALEKGDVSFFIDKWGPDRVITEDATLMCFDGFMLAFICQKYLIECAL